MGCEEAAHVPDLRASIASISSVRRACSAQVHGQVRRMEGFMGIRLSYKTPDTHHPPSILSYYMQ